RFAAKTPTATGSDAWKFRYPKSSDVIKWTSGKNYTDQVVHPSMEYGPETYFGGPGKTSTARPFDGFSRTDGPGPAGSTATTSGVTVTPSSPPSDVTYSLLSSLDEGPTENPSEVTTLPAIQSMLASDVATDRTLDNPLYIGILRHDIPVPTTAMDGNGTLAA